MFVSSKRLRGVSLGVLCLALFTTLGLTLSNQPVKGDECETMLLSDKCMPDRTFGPNGLIEPPVSCEGLPRAVECSSYAYTEGQDQETPHQVANSYSKVRPKGAANIICSISYNCKFDMETRTCKSVFQQNNMFGVILYEQTGCDPSNPNAPWPVKDDAEIGRE